MEGNEGGLATVFSVGLRLGRGEFVEAGAMEGAAALAETEPETEVGPGNKPAPAPALPLPGIEPEPEPGLCCGCWNERVVVEVENGLITGALGFGFGDSTPDDDDAVTDLDDGMGNNEFGSPGNLPADSAADDNADGKSEDDV
jgi:hypothetical protein